MADQSELIFALDIGTRTVTGLVVDDSAEVHNVLGSITLEHRSRAMLDGQIHDIEAVARVVRQVKEALEERLGLTLTHAAVAAAGRALLTRRGRIEREIAALGEIQAEDVREWELEAVQHAQSGLREEAVRTGTALNNDPTAIYHCVGYSVVSFELDGSKIKSLVGHRGRMMSAEVLATFLPEVVVDSLYAVLRRASLTVASMTLEPIAACNVVIPPDLRQLNLSLVDVGAGTSDIAITHHGSVTAYGMVPLAGDEISELLCDHFLLDFTTAERLKREAEEAARNGEELRFTDVLGMEHNVPATEIVSVIEPAVETLTSDVATCILALNERAPGAVICIGGGSLTPRFADKLREKLGLPVGRVAIRGREGLQIPVTGDLGGLVGPEAVTPVGIALSARAQSGLAFRSWEVTVNERRVRLFNLVEPRVADAILLAGVEVSRLRGRLGLALTARVNGEFRHIPGTGGEPGRVLVNGSPATLETPLSDGDQITAIYATDGQDAKAVVADLVPVVANTQVYFNGRRVTLKPLLTMDGKPASYDQPVTDGASVDFLPRNTLRDLLEMVDVRCDESATTPFTYYFNGELHSFPAPVGQVLVNGVPADPSLELVEGDKVEYVPGERVRPRVADVLESEGEAAVSTGNPLAVTVNGAPVLIPGTPGAVTINGFSATPGDLVPDGAQIKVERGNDATAYFAEVFTYVPLNVSERPVGKRLITRLNGVEAEYTAPLKDGDVIEVFWEGDPVE